jgi:deoxyribodipyrimidine photo-lyase
MAAADPPVIVWFRDDLRLSDHPALTEAAALGRPLVLVYVLDEESAGTRPFGGASRWWLHHSLAALSASLATHGQTLVLRHGAAADVLPSIASGTGATTVFWNRRHGVAPAIDVAAESALRKAGVAVRSFKANFLFEPDEVATQSGQPFRVFTPFWRAAMAKGTPRPPLPEPRSFPPPPAGVTGDDLDSWSLLPAGPDWAGGLREAWTPGERGAADRLDAFLDGIDDYVEGRDFPSEPATSRLSPHLRFGEISPFQIIAALDRLPPSRSSGKFRTELGWREFAWHVAAQVPDLDRRNIRPEFDRFPWSKADPKVVTAWRRGLTGYPIVDAGMRELWRTGWMHNRARMVVASFLSKHLLLDWRIGEAWFWDTLVDADAANNPFGWQWVAGSGVDAQPYFRIFNPVLQGEKFDPTGAYVRKWVPELARMPAKFVHKPWEASPIELAAAGITLGKDYPAPIVDHAKARARALAAFSAIGGKDETSSP